ncbi:methyltransferase domain-containing protein [Fuerstiella marisgermanici]|uniref:Arsenite methyltransferase n=1 Tax=Fuerstiella marisgermanici TaxID=1891926 RepID=A0A1P8WF37_9PLAN|nr:methyltransferase domain-containing protein [Fuerstiella marisgermanici]APZ92653.1 arsenite S-adenosylmethyltransferase [Fuerstiella marisgermanici]
MSATQPTDSLNVDAAVRDRYGAAAEAAEPALCCPVSYDAKYLKVIPDEIIERDYGCGDPSQYLKPGDHVLDLGSGGGKICYIASQVVGPDGYVVGVDINDQMLKLARQYQDEVASRIGFRNTDFRKGRIQDLQLNMELFEQHLQQHPVSSAADWLAADEAAAELREKSPLVASDSMDAVVSNCVLNLVRNEDRYQLFAEVFRVLKRGGRAIISDIVSDEDVPTNLQNNAELWSGCISGAFREDRFLEAFEAAGFYGLEIVNRQEEAWAVVDGIEFRSLTVRAWKGKEGPCLDRHQAVIYNGPWKTVTDDDGHKLFRGERMAVCDKTFKLYTSAPYADQMTPIVPVDDIPIEQAANFDCRRSERRDPKFTKQGKPKLDLLPGTDCCGTTDCC